MSSAYAEYLKSQHWLGLRGLALKRDGGMCRRCGSKAHLEVHHMFYRKSWLLTQLEDLMVFCASCHERHHELMNRPIPKAPPVKWAGAKAVGMGQEAENRSGIWAICQAKEKAKQAEE